MTAPPRPSPSQTSFVTGPVSREPQQARDERDGAGDLQAARVQARSEEHDHRRDRPDEPKHGDAPAAGHPEREERDREQQEHGRCLHRPHRPVECLRIRVQPRQGSEEEVRERLIRPGRVEQGRERDPRRRCAETKCGHGCVAGRAVSPLRRRVRRNRDDPRVLRKPPLLRVVLCQVGARSGFGQDATGRWLADQLSVADARRTDEVGPFVRCAVRRVREDPRDEEQHVRAREGDDGLVQATPLRRLISFVAGSTHRATLKSSGPPTGAAARAVSAGRTG